MRNTALNKENWSQEDYELAAEFAEETAGWREEAVQVGRVSWRLNRKVRQLARYQLSNDLASHWVWGAVPKVSLVAVMVFAVGLYVLMYQPQGIDELPISLDPPAATMESTAPDSELPPTGRKSPAVAERALQVDPAMIERQMRQMDVQAEAAFSAPAVSAMAAEADSLKTPAAGSWIDVVILRNADGEITSTSITGRCILLAGSCQDNLAYDDAAKTRARAESNGSQAREEIRLTW